MTWYGLRGPATYRGTDSRKTNQQPTEGALHCRSASCQTASMSERCWIDFLGRMRTPSSSFRGCTSRSTSRSPRQDRQPPVRYSSRRTLSHLGCSPSTRHILQHKVQSYPCVISKSTYVELRPTVFHRWNKLRVGDMPNRFLQKTVLNKTYALSLRLSNRLAADS